MICSGLVGRDEITIGVLHSDWALEVSTLEAGNWKVDAEH